MSCNSFVLFMLFWVPGCDSTFVRDVWACSVGVIQGYRQYRGLRRDSFD